MQLLVTSTQREYFSITEKTTKIIHQMSNNTHKLQMRTKQFMCSTKRYALAINYVFIFMYAMRFRNFTCATMSMLFCENWMFFSSDGGKKLRIHTMSYYTCSARFIIQTESFMTLFVALANWRARANAYVHFTHSGAGLWYFIIQTIATEPTIFRDWYFPIALT